MLKPKKKITRKELKKDPVLEKISQIENLVRKQRKLVSYILLGVVVVVLLTILLVNSKKKSQHGGNGRTGTGRNVICPQ